MTEEKLKFVGTYVTEELYFRFKVQCDRKRISVSKALMHLMMVFAKNVTLDEPKTDVEENVKSASD